MNEKIFCEYLLQPTFFVSKVLKKLKVPYSKYFNLWRQKYLTKYLIETYSDIIKKYSHCEEKEMTPGKKIIWIFWWQGLSDAPDLVKTCISSIMKNSNGAQVVVLSKRNFEDYVSLSKHVMDKFEHGKITLTHLSDLVRFNLLSKFGGLWLDATIYCAKEISSEYFSYKLVTCSGYPDNESFNISNGRWTGFLIGGVSQNTMFHFMNEFFDAYWEKEDKLMDYFLIDYILDLAYQYNVGNFETILNNSKLRNPRLFDLQDLLNEKFNDVLYSSLIEETIFFKLSYKKELKNSSDTFFFYLKNEQRV